MLIARAVRLDEEEAWDLLARARGELYQQPAWVSALAGRAAKVGVFDSGGNLLGGFVVEETRRWGVRVLRNAPFCQGAGPFWEPRATTALAQLEERRRIVDAMAEFLLPKRGVTFVRLSLRAEDVLPFCWRDYRTSVEYTYRMSLGSSVAHRFSLYSESRRRSIRRAEKDGLNAEINENGSDVLALQRETLKRERAGGAALLPAVLEATRHLPGSFVVNVKRDDEFLAGCLVAIWKDTAYYILGGHREAGVGGGHHGAGALALHVAMTHAAQAGCEVFDFEGSTIPRLEPFVRGFGGALTPYYSVAKAWLPLECGLKPRYRRYF